MPHYSDGKPASTGDLVRGRGYNLKAEIEGYILKVVPDQESCNVVLGTTQAKWDADQGLGFVAYSTIEYGEARSFTKLPADGPSTVQDGGM